MTQIVASCNMLHVIFGFFLWSNILGEQHVSKSDEFSEKFQTAFDPPPPSFSENHIAIFFQNSWPKDFYVIFFCETFPKREHLFDLLDPTFLGHGLFCKLYNLPELGEGGGEVIWAMPEIKRFFL